MSFIWKYKKRDFMATHPPTHDGARRQSRGGKDEKKRKKIEET
jgi:hypothetical protein